MLRFSSSCKATAIGLLLLGLPVLVAGCGGGSSATTTTTNASTPLLLTDAPLAGAQAVTVSIDKIEAHAVGGAFVDTGVAPQPNIDLLSLKSTELLLGNAKLAPGKYTALRLTISNPTITIAGTTSPLVPVTGHGGASAAQKHGADTTASSDGKSATLLVAAPFTVAADGSSSPLLLDFNVARSIVATGNGQYLLKPVIPVVHKDDSGMVSGAVALSPPPAPGSEPDVEVSVMRHGQTDPSQEENGTEADDAANGGGFTAHALSSGTYDVTVTAQGYAPVTLPSVTITPGSHPNLGTITLHKP
jgi:hypothetical protein